MIVLYHGDCYDGFGAAWVAHMFDDAATLIPVVHGGPVPDLPAGADVYMIDFSYPRQMMEILAEHVNLRVLDHHKTAEAALKGFPNSVFDLDRSGAMLAWDEFFPNETPSILVQYVQDRDLYLWKMPFSREVNAWIETFERTLSNWTFMEYELKRRFTEIVNEGIALLRYKQQKVEEITASAQWLNVGGHIVPVCNVSAFFAETADRLCIKYPDAAFAAYYFDRADGQRQWGLRSNNGFDVSEIAKLYAGGGHPAAAGFQTLQPSNVHIIEGV
jgi:uncharacterized protein